MPVEPIAGRIPGRVLLDVTEGAQRPLFIFLAATTACGGNLDGDRPF
jgi:hypothetical protein